MRPAARVAPVMRRNNFVPRATVAPAGKIHSSLKL